jgi:hypothetical protein
LSPDRAVKYRAIEAHKEDSKDSDYQSSSLEQRINRSGLPISRDAPESVPRTGRQNWNSASTDAAIYGGIAEMNAYNDSRALVPYKKPSSLKDSKSRTRARAIQELERIQKLKQEKEMRLAE